MAPAIHKDANRTPIAGQDQIGRTVAIQIAPDGAADKADLCKQSVVRFIRHQASVAIEVNARGRGLRIAPGEDPSTDEQVERAISVDVGDGKRSGAGGQVLEKESTF